MTETLSFAIRSTDLEIFIAVGLENLSFRKFLGGHEQKGESETYRWKLIFVVFADYDHLAVMHLAFAVQSVQCK